MSTTIILQEFKVEDFIIVEDFINIDSGDLGITITKFNGKIKDSSGQSGCMTEILLNIEQAIDLMNELNYRIGLLKEEAQNE